MTEQEPTAEETAMDNALLSLYWWVATDGVDRKIVTNARETIDLCIGRAVDAQKEKDAKLVETRGRFLPVAGDTLQESIEFERRCIAAAIRAGREDGEARE